MTDRHTKQKSATDIAYERIRDGIVSNELEPGSRLTIRAMAKLTGVSIIPVIQALHTLENEGLVETFPNWGSRVVTLDRETTRDRYLLRQAVECQIARVLTQGLSPDKVSYLRELAAKLDEFVSRGTPPGEFWDHDFVFHETMARFTECKSLYKALGNINLFRLMQRTKEQVLLQHISLPKDLHMSLVDAIESGDPDKAERQMREHIMVSTKGWISLV